MSTSTLVPIAVSPAEAASLLGVCRATVYNLIGRGELHAFKVGRCTRIAFSEVQRLASAEVAA